MKHKIDLTQVKKSQMALRALNHKLRQQILATIETAKEITVTQIYVKLRIEQSVASQHLAILRKARIVNTRRDGKLIYYTVNFNRILQIEKCVGELNK
jgi:ArsR family transcriptional regulator, virulence genes transcriptional regulator